MRVGCHVSISGSIDMAVDNAVKRGCSAFQIFTSNPRGWRTRGLAEKEIRDFSSKVEESGIDRSATCAHMPYLPNLATPKADGFKRSVDTLIRESERCSRLNIPYLVTHLGSHLGTGEDAGIERLVEGLEAGARSTSGTIILLENTAGQKNSVGSDFGQLGAILRRLSPADRFGVCFDTCHAFVAGYDLRTGVKVRETFEEFDRHVGIEHLRVIHLNDARGDIGCNLDRHYHLGLGKIGTEGISAVIKFANKNDIPIILETPIDDDRDDYENIRVAKDLA